MKRILSVSVLFLYLLTSTGMTISVDYCMGEASGFSIDHIEADEEDDCCKKSCACCTSRTAFIKMDDSQQRAAGHSFNGLFPAEACLFYCVSFMDAGLPGETLVPKHFALQRPCPIYLSNNNFRI